MMMLPRQRGISAMILVLTLIVTIYSVKKAESLFTVRYIVGPSNPFKLSKLVHHRSTNKIDDNIPLISDVPLENKHRKRRKNKYENFSRVNVDIDPLETLIEESKRKNQDLLNDKDSSQRTPKTDVSAVTIPSLPNKVFPDVKSIDVSATNFHFSLNN